MYRIWEVNLNTGAEKIVRESDDLRFLKFIMTDLREWHASMGRTVNFIDDDIFQVSVGEYAFELLIGQTKESAI